MHLLILLMNNFKKIIKREVSFLSSAKNRFLLIGFVAIYAILFITLYEPFNINQWGGNYYWQFIMVGTAILFVTQFALRSLFRIKNFTYLSLFLWYLLEVTIMAYFFYLLFGDELSAYSEQFKEYLLTFRYTALILIVPYTVFVWYMEHKYGYSKLKAEKAEIIEAGTKDKDKLLTIKGENGKVALAIKYGQLVYVKSAGNYLELFYMKGETLVKELIRGSIKEFEVNIQDYKPLLRIHRSYIVNFNYLHSFKRTKKGYILIMQHVPDVELSVSSSYKDIFEERLKKVSSPLVTT